MALPVGGESTASATAAAPAPLPGDHDLEKVPASTVVALPVGEKPTASATAAAANVLLLLLLRCHSLVRGQNQRLKFYPHQRPVEDPL